ncbi:hypothetical protein GTQ99_06935 [Kineococcus sp. T13]|uniref:hypothetical protein n=1 Tax=Kineococcus vitellinus TaxID=2696565 RepID=UPI00141223C2|nr:hypothetical protein [Kineococcus vitellinus]NAZ75158.1 hypothetical protein [Kineococcus vitellinus]
MIVLFVVFASVVLVLAVLERSRPGRGARRPARTTPSWLRDGDTGAGSAGGGGFADGGGCGDGGGGGGSC